MKNTLLRLRAAGQKRKLKSLGRRSVVVSFALLAIAVYTVQQSVDTTPQALTSRSTTSIAMLHARHLVKPDPSVILGDKNVQLTATQRSRLLVVEAKWQAERDRIVTAMKPLAPESGNMARISSNLEAYSELSRKFDAIRTGYWFEALSVLSPSQQIAIQKELA